MKYRNFYLIARIIGILAWIGSILIFALFLYAGFTAETELGLTIPLMIMVGLVTALFTFILLYALSQFIYVTIDIERNTRQTLRALLEEVETEEDETEEDDTEEEE